MAKDILKGINKNGIKECIWDLYHKINSLNDDVNEINNGKDATFTHIHHSNDGTTAGPKQAFTATSNNVSLNYQCSKTFKNTFTLHQENIPVASDTLAGIITATNATWFSSKETGRLDNRNLIELFLSGAEGYYHLSQVLLIVNEPTGLSDSWREIDEIVDPVTRELTKFYERADTISTPIDITYFDYIDSGEFNIKPELLNSDNPNIESILLNSGIDLSILLGPLADGYVLYDYINDDCVKTDDNYNNYMIVLRPLGDLLYSIIYIPVSPSTDLRSASINLYMRKALINSLESRLADKVDKTLDDLHSMQLLLTNTFSAIVDEGDITGTYELYMSIPSLHTIDSSVINQINYICSEGVIKGVVYSIADELTDTFHIIYDDQRNELIYKDNSLNTHVINSVTILNKTTSDNDPISLEIVFTMS